MENSSMKDSQTLAKIIVAVVLAAVVAGCTSQKPAKLTTIPGMKPAVGGPGTLPPIGPGDGGTLPPGGTVNPPGTGGTPTTSNPTNPEGPFSNPALKENRTMFFNEMLQFEYDSASIRPADMAKVQAVAKHLIQQKEHLMVVEGHCDERGTDEYNRSLGERRALAVREQLLKLGVESARVRTISYGKEIPLVDGKTEDAFKKNRRGEFVLLEPNKQL